MDKKEVMSKLQEVFREVFDNDEIEINENTVAEDIEEWDSLAHVQLTEKVQSVFGVKFSAKEMMSWEDVGELADSIIEKMA